MKLEEVVPQLHDKITYFICLNRTTSYPKLCITKTSDIKKIKFSRLSSLELLTDVSILSLGGERTTLVGIPIMSVIINPKEIVEYKHSYIRFNTNRDHEDWYIAQTKQGLANAVKTLFKKYKLSPIPYKYLITTIKNSE